MKVSELKHMLDFLSNKIIKFNKILSYTSQTKDKPHLIAFLTNAKEFYKVQLEYANIIATLCRVHIQLPVETQVKNKRKMFNLSHIESLGQCLDGNGLKSFS